MPISSKKVNEELGNLKVPGHKVNFIGKIEKGNIKVIILLITKNIC